MKRVLYLTGMILLAGWMQTDAQQVGSEAPDFEVDLLGGETFKLSEQEGRVVLVFLFGNTCPSCLAIGPTVESSLYQEYMGNANFTAVGLDTWNTSSNENTVTNFKTTTGISFPLGLKANAVAAAYSTTYDRLMVIDQEGILVHKGVLAAANDIDNAGEAIEESLAVTGSVHRTGLSGVNVYPNPSAGMVTFDPANQEITGLTLHDASGRVVMEERVPVTGQSAAPWTLNLEQLEQGIYFYRLSTPGANRISGHLVIRR